MKEIKYVNYGDNQERPQKTFTKNKKTIMENSQTNEPSGTKEHNKKLYLIIRTV